ncbi:MAG: alanine racemase [Bacteroidales bacterium]|nr:alanine racemase [Bacteroidales bacterium]
MKKASEQPKYPRLEISEQNLLHNSSHFRSKLMPETAMLVLLKANAYGFGMDVLADELQDLGLVDYFGIAYAKEGIQLRSRGIRLPIIAFTAGVDSYPEFINYGIEPNLPDMYSVRLFRECVKARGLKHIPAQIKIDTGMHRTGFMERDLPELMDFLAKDDTIYVKGIYSHLAAADSPAMDAFSLEQAALFDRLSSQIHSFLGYQPIRHLYNTAGIERFAELYPQYQYDMVRLGIGMYGIETMPREDVRPIATLKVKVVQIKHLSPEDGTVGYDRRGKIERPSVIATVDIGYADGIDRRLGNGRGHFLVNGQMVPTIGNICMDAVMLDVTGVDVKEGDIVTIFGANPRIEDIATQLDTIPYEVATSVSSRVIRTIVR